MIWLGQWEFREPPFRMSSYLAGPQAGQGENHLYKLEGISDETYRTPVTLCSEKWLFFFFAFNIVMGNMYHFWVQELISVKVVCKSSTGPFPGDAGVKKWFLKLLDSNCMPLHLYLGLPFFHHINTHWGWRMVRYSIRCWVHRSKFKEDILMIPELHKANIWFWRQ